MPDGKTQLFEIEKTNGGFISISLYFDCECYNSLVTFIEQRPGTEILQKDERREYLEYLRYGCKFSILTIPYSDFFLGGHWDDDPYIEFRFVEKDHPDFETYVYELVDVFDFLKKRESELKV